MTIAVLIGSLRQESFNKTLAALAAEQAPEGVDCMVVDIGRLPLFNEDIENPLPEEVAVFKGALKSADGILVVTPEYNRSIPGVLKNAIDWASRSGKESAWAGKPVGIMGASPGQFGTITAQFDLRRILAHTGSLVMPQPQVLVTMVENKLTDGQLDEATAKVVKKYMQALTDWIDRTKAE